MQVKYFRGSIHDGKGTLEIAVNAWLEEMGDNIAVISIAISAPSAQNGDVCQVILYSRVS